LVGVAAIIIIPGTIPVLQKCNPAVAFFHVGCVSHSLLLLAAVVIAASVDAATTAATNIGIIPAYIMLFLIIGFIFAFLSFLQQITVYIIDDNHSVLN
jgi:hypothetical protein